MSLFKAFANFCRRSNEKALKKTLAKQRKSGGSSSYQRNSGGSNGSSSSKSGCCATCQYLQAGKSCYANPFEHDPIEIDDIYNTCCKDYKPY